MNQVAETWLSKWFSHFCYLSGYDDVRICTACLGNRWSKLDWKLLKQLAAGQQTNAVWRNLKIKIYRTRLQIVGSTSEKTQFVKSSLHVSNWSFTGPVQTNFNLNILFRHETFKIIIFVVPTKRTCTMYLLPPIFPVKIVGPWVRKPDWSSSLISCPVWRIIVESVLVDSRKKVFKLFIYWLTGQFIRLQTIWLDKNSVLLKISNIL